MPAATLTAVRDRSSRVADAGRGWLSGGRSVVGRLAASALALVLVLGATDAIPAAAASPARVAVIVGPVGSLTDRFRAMGEEAAVAAERAGAAVTRVYSPDATWPAVRAAIMGASIVVYLGHGNGWPSPYRDHLYPPTQNGFGLNPVAGQDDSTHQYFGEQYVDDARLAPGAVVLLHHLCYASGNSEPDLAEVAEETAIARVDNFAAGFLRAGARAVVAEAHAGPAWYVERLLRGSRSIEALWRDAPWRHGHERSAPSTRSPGAVLTLDPDHLDGGWNRSLVVAAGGRGLAPGRNGQAIGAIVPSLAWIGFGTPSLATRPAAGAETTLLLPVPPDQRRLLPGRVQVGLRWVPLAARATPAGATETASPAPDPSAMPDRSPEPDPNPLPDPDGLVVPERDDAVVVTEPAELTDGGLEVTTAFPPVPGTYRLVITLHDRDGVAFDAATQSLISPLIVKVPRALGAEMTTPLRLSGEAGSYLRLAVLVRNTGSVAWDLDLFQLGDVAPSSPWYGIRTAAPARLIGTWASPSGAAVPRRGSVEIPIAIGRPGGGGIVELLVAVPADPGSYLLVLDIESPARGSLALAGVAPIVIEVRVSGA